MSDPRFETDERLQEAVLAIDLPAVLELLKKPDFEVYDMILSRLVNQDPGARLQDQLAIMRLFMADPRTSFPREKDFVYGDTGPVLFVAAAWYNNLAMMRLLATDPRVYLEDYFLDFDEETGDGGITDALNIAIQNGNLEMLQLILGSRWNKIERHHVMDLVKVYRNKVLNYQEIARLLLTDHRFPYKKATEDYFRRAASEELMQLYYQNKDNLKFQVR